MDFLDPKIEAYVLENSSSEPTLLKELNRETNANVLMPRMLSGHLQGRVLSMLSSMIRPKRVLEIGTYTGYSAICLCEGLAPDGILYTIDINEELQTMVKTHIAKAGLEKKTNYIIGNAIEVIPTINESFDLVFIDADKINYSNYYDLVIEKIPSGAFIIADNVLWSGKVVNDGSKMDTDTKAIHAFNQKIQNDNRVENVLFPVRDGLMVIRKK